MRRALLLLALLLSCRPFDPVLCAPCEQTCPYGLECVQGMCVSDMERCGILERPADACGDGPACRDGFECFEETCRTPVEVATGGAHACVRWPSGRVSCWGNNLFGQCGPGEEAIMPAPQVIEGIDDAVALALGGQHSCALRSNGQVVCWGDNRAGQLGNFTAYDVREAFRSEATPQTVYLDEPIAHLAAGDFHTCATGTPDDTGARTTWCWGAGGFSGSGGCILGDHSIEPSQLPLALSGAPAFESLDAGQAHSVGLAGARAFGWGTDEAGQLGNGGQAACTPIDLGIDDAVSVTAGAGHTCVLDGTGRAHCLGFERYGQLGGGLVELEEPFEEVEAAGFHTCGRVSSGRIACWGSNSRAQLGSLDSSVRGPRFVAGTEGAQQFDTGGGLVCFVRDGDGVYCWGNGSSGQLADGVSSARKPGLILEGDFVEVHSGTDGTCARESSGAVWCWGKNGVERVGSEEPTAEPPRQVPDLTASALAVGFHYVCVIDGAGFVSCWGRYDRPVYGLEDTPQFSVPTRVANTYGAERIIAGWMHACAVFEEGQTLRCWGANFDGAITGTPTGHIFTEAQTIEGVSDVAHIAAGDAYTCVVDSAGELTCWGRVESFGTDVDLEEVADLTAAVQHLCLRRPDGTAACWGQNELGQLGNGTTRSGYDTLRPVFGLDRVVQIDNTARFSCALREAGDVWCWGQDYLQGRLGQGPTHDRPVPVRVPDIPPARAIGVGNDAACSVSETGSVYCWGNNGAGQVSGVPPVMPSPKRIENLR